MKRLDTVPVRYKSALSALRWSSDIVDRERDDKNASASSMNSSTPRPDVADQSNSLCSSVTACRPSGPTSPPLMICTRARCVHRHTGTQQIHALTAYSSPALFASFVATSVLPVPARARQSPHDASGTHSSHTPGGP